jgi:hypothetical protein
MTLVSGFGLSAGVFDASRIKSELIPALRIELVPVGNKYTVREQEYGFQYLC